MLKIEAQLDMYCHNVECGLHGLVQPRAGWMDTEAELVEADYECCDECEDLMYYYPYDTDAHPK